MSQVGHCYYPDQPPRAPSVLLVRTCRAWSLFLIWSMCSSAIHLADTRPHSPTTITYKDSPHTSIIGSSHTIYGEAGYAPTCAYRLLSFPVCQLGSHNIALSHCFSTYPDDALNDPRIITPATHFHQHPFVACVGVSTTGLHFSSFSKHRPMSTVLFVDRTKQVAEHATRGATAAPAQLTADRCHTMFVGPQKYGDQVRARRESITGPIHALSTDSPSSARSPTYIL